MRRFHCLCGQPIFFDNTICKNCGRAVGYSPDRGSMMSLDHLTSKGNKPAVTDESGNSYRVCLNRVKYEVCNWLLPYGDEQELCLACNLSRNIPVLSHPENLERWARLESAKRRLIYTLLNQRLPVVSGLSDPEQGLIFDFLEDKRDNPNVSEEHIATGHADGVITINVIESDPVKRVRTRERMNEQYRTLLGHMRHESGHYYWDRLIRDRKKTFRFRFSLAFRGRTW